MKTWIIQEVRQGQTGEEIVTHAVAVKPYMVAGLLSVLRGRLAPHLGKKTAPIQRVKVATGQGWVCLLDGGRHLRAFPVPLNDFIDWGNVPDITGLAGPQPQPFEIWEFDDGEIGRFSYGKDPDENLSLNACTDGPGWCIYQTWRGEANERQPLIKIGDTQRRPGEVGR